MYYLRTQAATQAVQFTVEKQEKAVSQTAALEQLNPDITEGSVCSMEEGCISCGS